MSLTYQTLPIDDLDLDTENPRIQKWIEQYGDNPSFEQMFLALQAGSGDLETGGTGTFQSLRDSIRANGGVINPIIVQRKPGGRFKVIEGNTRVAIYREFSEEEVPGNWKSMPAMVHDELPRVQVDAIRLQCHIVGPRQWDPYSKAKYLHHLLNEEHIPMAQIVELCGGRRKELSEYIDAYHDMEKYYRPILADDGDFDATRFSSFIELQKAGIKNAVLDEGFSITNFAEWVRDKKIDPQMTVRALPRILRHTQAKAKFLAVNAREALRILDVPAAPAIGNVPLEQLLAALVERLNVLPWAEVNAMKGDPGGQKAQLMTEAHQAIGEICKDISPE